VSSGFDADGKISYVPKEFLRTLGGIEYDPDFGYLAEFIEYGGPPLQKEGPSISLVFDSVSECLLAKSYFLVERQLSEPEIQRFMCEYDGQMSDGFGEIMVQDFSERYNVEFDLPYAKEPKSTFTQEPC